MSANTTTYSSPRDTQHTFLKTQHNIFKTQLKILDINAEFMLLYNV